jgi:hypothetical protein
MSNFERRRFLKHAGTGLAVTVLGLRAQQALRNPLAATAAE